MFQPLGMEVSKSEARREAIQVLGIKWIANCLKEVLKYTPSYLLSNLNMAPLFRMEHLM